MTLGEFAYLLDVNPKWVHNVASVLPDGLRYTLPTARRLAVARELSDKIGMPMPRAYELAADVLRRYDGSEAAVPAFQDHASSVSVMIDVYRILSTVNTGLSRLRTLYAPRQRGRRGVGREPIQTAKAYGLDASLLAANLRRAPAERLRQLDAMIDFRSRVRRS